MTVLSKTRPEDVASLPPDVSGSARIAELSAEICALRAENARASMIRDSAIDYAIITMDTSGLVTSWNAGAQAIMGYAECAVIGLSGEIIFTQEDRAVGRFATEMRLAIDKGRARNERWHMHQDGNRFWASGMMMPLLDESGLFQGFLNILRDGSDERAAVEQRELLMAEMSHRIKNTFAIVLGVASQTRRHTETAAEFQAAFSARLKVLAHSNEILIRSDWRDAQLRDVIAGVLDAHNGEPGRITMDGPSVLLAVNLVVTISLSFGELVTNAVKYGALSEPAGRLHVCWTITCDRREAATLEIVWRERGGPVVKPPQQRGFGSQLLEKGMPTGGAVTLDFQPEGVECRICLPLNGANGSSAAS